LNPIREDPENPTQGLPLNMIFLIVALAWMLPGGIIGIIIYFKTKSTEPPHLLLNIYAVISFIQSIAMINFAANSIVDLLQLIGFITGLPQALLSLSILAWANSLGDMSADVAMTKKGFGEMAMTATVAGPVMNILLGQGLSMMIGIVSFNKGT
jgi:sodium/potassium/calcium exchanger 6